jgi:hypothetical protein
MAEWVRSEDFKLVNKSFSLEWSRRFLLNCMWPFFKEFLVDEDGFLLDDYVNMKTDRLNDIWMYYKKTYIISNVEASDNIIKIELIKRRSNKLGRPRVISSWDLPRELVINNIKRGSEDLYFFEEVEAEKFLNSLIVEFKVEKREKSLNRILKSKK